MLEMAVLGLLTEDNLHGYEIKKRLAETLGGGASFGSLYPALGRLERAGAITALPDATSGRVAGVPLTGSLGGELAAYRARRAATRGLRGKKVYGITAEGRRMFEEMLADAGDGDDDRAFHFRLAFARHLSPDARLGMLERRRLALMDRLGAIRGRVRSGLERLDAYGRSLADRDRAATELDISWVERLIAAERAGLTAQPPGPPPGGPTPAAAGGHPAPFIPAQATSPSGARRSGGTDRPSLSGLRQALQEETPR